MIKTLLSSLTILAFSGSLALAQSQTACDATKMAERLDRYAAQPFGALNWRVLNGLGDPEIEASAGFDNWESQDDYKKLTQQILKLEAVPEIGYDCRTAYPLSVLKGHVAKFGANDSYVMQWARTQQQVFGACTDANAPIPVLVDPLTGIDQAREAAQRYDRAYQTASIAFYNNKSKAVELFRTIGSSPSPHRAAARYNVANLLANGKQLDEARREATEILADPSLTTVHTITKELLGYIANLEDSAAGWSSLIDEATKTLGLPQDDIQSSPDHRREFARALSDIDFAGIRAKDEDWWITGRLPENPTISKAIVDATRKSPMALWMVGGQSLFEKQQRLGWALRHNKWESYAADYANKISGIMPAAGNLPPLARDVLAALVAPANAASLQAKANEVAAKTVASCGTAPETAALPVYLEQAIRSSAAQGDFEPIYRTLQQSPLRQSELLSTRLPQRLMSYLLATGNVEEGRRLRDALLSDAQLSALPEPLRLSFGETATRFKAWVAEDENAWRNAVVASSASSSSPLLNLLTSDELWSLSEDVRFSNSERALFARAAWTRAYARSRSTRDETLKKLLAADARLAQSFAALQKEFPKLSTERQQLLFVLRNPRLGLLVNAPNSWEQTGLEIDADQSYEDLGSGDHNDRNWWCPLQLDRHLGAIRDAFDADADIPALPDEYSKADWASILDNSLRDKIIASREAILIQHKLVKHADWKGLQRLAVAPSAPRKLTEAAIRWGKVSGGQDGAPEALARAIAATRYGCNWSGGHGKYSKAAHDLLNKRYKDSPYAAQSPYWFDCMRNEWDASGNRVSSCEPKIWPKQSLPK